MLVVVVVVESYLWLRAKNSTQKVVGKTREEDSTHPRTMDTIDKAKWLLSRAEKSKQAFFFFFFCLLILLPVILLLLTL